MPDDLIARLLDPEWRGPMQHLRAWSELDAIMDEAAAALAAWQAAQPAPPPFNAQRVADINARGIIDEVCGEWAIETPQGFATALWSRLAASLSVAPSPPLPAGAPPGFVRVRIPVHLNADGLGLANCRFKEGAMEDWITLSGYQRHIIIADVPLPQPPAEVTGRVET